MTSVYSTQFFAGDLQATLATLYRVATGQTVVLRDLEMSNSSGASVDAWLGVQASGILIPLLIDAALPSATSKQWTGRTVLNGGDAIVSFATSSNVGAVASGYLFNN